MKLRFGFIGIGAMGLSHVKQFHVTNAGRSEAVAVCARSEANIKKAREVAPQVKVFADEKELIHSDLDVVCISSPNFTHVPLALETLRAGKHLFLEKPCGITQEECRQLRETADKTDKGVMIGHELRYSPFFQHIKSLVQMGEVGTPRMVWTREFRGPFQPKSQNWIQDERKSGGMMVDKNCHHFDMMNWWVGARPKRVSAFGKLAVSRVIEGPHQVNDHSTVSFEYENGVIGTLQICLFARDFPGEDLEMGIVGDKGELRARIVPPPQNPTGSTRAQSGTLEILQWKRGSGKSEPIVHKVESKLGQGWGNHLGFDEMHAAFLDAVIDGKSLLTTVRDCANGTLLAIAAEESIKRDRKSVV